MLELSERCARYTKMPVCWIARGTPPRANSSNVFGVRDTYLLWTLLALRKEQRLHASTSNGSGAKLACSSRPKPQPHLVPAAFNWM